MAVPKSFIPSHTLLTEFLRLNIQSGMSKRPPRIVPSSSLKKNLPILPAHSDKLFLAEAQAAAIENSPASHDINPPNIVVLTASLPSLACDPGV